MSATQSLFIKTWIVAISVNLPFPFFAQDTLVSLSQSNQNYKISVGHYLVLLREDFTKQASSPFLMSKKQLINLGAFSLVTTGLILSDATIDNYANHLRNHSSFINKSSPVITRFGADYAMYTVGAYELYGLLFKDHWAQATALLATQAMITSGVWAQIGKFFTGRERPSVSYTNSLKEGGVWHGPFHSFDYDSDTRKLTGSSYDAFPSGHTATAFSIATVFAKMYCDKPAIPIIAYSAATAVGLSRITEHTHWMSDVVVGAALGYLCGTQVVNNYRRHYAIHASSGRIKNLSININYMHSTFLSGISCNF